MRMLFDNLLSDDCLIITLLISMCGAVSTSGWFLCRCCRCSIENLYRLSAVWPAIMLLVFFWSFGHFRTGRHLSPVIALAFGFGFSVANLRIPSVYSRSLGVVF